MTRAEGGAGGDRHAPLHGGPGRLGDDQRAAGVSSTGDQQPNFSLRGPLTFGIVAATIQMAVLLWVLYC